MKKRNNNVVSIKVQALHKGFSTKKVLNDVNLTLEAGSITAMIGKNGAGKSTLLNVLSGETSGDSGTCIVETCGGSLPLTKWDAVMLPQSFTLPDYLKVKEVFYHLKNISPYPNYYERCFNTLHLQPISDLFINQLSAGQRQKVYLGLVLASHKNIILLDEPTSAMDLESREQAWELVRWRAKNKCIVAFSSHSDKEIQSLANQFVFLDSGEVIKIIAVEELPSLIKEGYCVQVEIQKKELQKLNGQLFNQSTYCEESSRLNIVVSQSSLTEAISQIMRSDIESRIISIENSLIKNTRLMYIEEIGR